MKKHLYRLLLTSLWLCAVVSNSLSAALVTYGIYDDMLAAGWDNWSWAQVNLGATAPVHSGSSSIAVTMDAWEGLYLHKGEVETLGTSQLRFFMHGGSSGGQDLNVFMNLEVNGSAQNGPAIAVPSPTANTWFEVLVPLSSLNPLGATITGITWQDASGGSQPTFYIDDISLYSPEDLNAPQLAEPGLKPRSAPADGMTTLIVRARVSDPQGSSDLAAVTLDASGLGRGNVTLRDDGRSNDGSANDGLYGTVITIATGTPTGEQTLLVSAVDQAGHAASMVVGVVSVLGTPGGTIPAALPQRIGWGSNAWSETPGDDWQENSGVAWDYVYQYITYGWESWGGSFVERFVNQAWDKGYIPVVTVYMMLAVPPNCGEGGSCYASKLQNAATVQAYIDSLERAAQEAQGSQAVIFNLEPDFYGFMQQLSNSDSRPPGVLPDDPTSYPVALNKAGYTNTLAGFGRYLVDLIHTTAPNALAAPMASTWSTNGDPQSVTDAQAIDMAERTATFIAGMGGAQADLLVVEWSDRDAGSGLRPWWDDSDQQVPRPTRAVLWENALSRRADKRLMLWQMPVGNMALENVCLRYQDNRAAYAFAHASDLFAAGVAGVVFGGGDGCSTQVTTDGGFVAAQGAVAYAPPTTPGGLSSMGSVGLMANLRWNENSEPDLEGYRLYYRLNPAGVQASQDTGRRNSWSLMLPGPGTWEVRVAAYDAMGNQSTMSSAVLISITTTNYPVFLPLIRR